MPADRPLVLSAPEPRTLELIFTPEDLAELRSTYALVEAPPAETAALVEQHIGEALFVIGQPQLPASLIERAKNLRAVFNVETNFTDHVDYESCFRRGIHVLSTGKVFAEPVAEIGLGLALCLARNICGADRAFREGRELWGGDGNQAARLLSGGTIGFIGFGDLGRALHRLLAGFRAHIKVSDPWLPPGLLREAGVEPASLDEVLETSDMVFVVASVTSDNGGFLGERQFAAMKPGAGLVLLSRAGVVDFEALMAAVRSGHILAASDVFPEEPLALDHPVRSLEGMVLSAHRAGALDIAFKRMGRMVLEDMDLMRRGLPPLACRRAERETVARMRSKPVTKN